jgi:zinc finger SWIM domain-containing protein 3
MQKAVKLVWPNSSHRLCSWHIELNIVRNIEDDDMREAIRCFLYDRCSIQEIEMKWMAFPEKEKITEDLWL